MTENELILTSILNCPRHELYLNEFNLTSEQSVKYEEIKHRRENGEPLQYLLGETAFYGQKIFVNKSVLIPRPETELLVERAIEAAKSLGNSGETLKILDLGTGSGNIAISLANNITNSKVYALDVSKEALAVAQKNAKLNLVDHKIEFLCQDMISFLENNCDGQFSLIVSNPPYIPTNKMKSLPKDVQMEPKIALDGGEEGLDFYEKIIAVAYQKLTKNGYLIMEVGDAQSAKVKKMLNNFAEYTNINITKDFAGTDRIIKTQIK